MTMEEKATRLRALTELNGISGHETQVAKFVLAELKKLQLDAAVDNIGNITVHLPATQVGRPRLMLFGHMDEIGMIVKQLDPSGCLRFERVGGVHRQILPGTQVTVTDEDGRQHSGVVGVKSHHIIPQEEKAKIPDIEKLYIDIGSSSAAETARRGIKIGDIITYKANWTEYGEGVVSCKALDDRAAVELLLSLLERLQASTQRPDVYVVFSVMEEFNIRGIMPAVRKIRPDLCIGVDITPAYDTPDLMGQGTIRLGEGPGITYMNFHGRGTLAGLIHSEKFNRFLCSVAEENDIPVQREVCIGVITETGFTVFEGEEGIISAGISIPMRYTHTPNEMISLRDLSAIEQLLYAATVRMKALDDFRLLSKNDLPL